MRLRHYLFLLGLAMIPVWVFCTWFGMLLEAILSAGVIFLLVSSAVMMTPDTPEQ